MRQLPKQRIAKSALTVWRMTAMLEVLIEALFIGAYVVMSVWLGWPMWIAWAASGLLVLYAIAIVVIIPSVRWKRWRYEVMEEEVDLQEGVFITKRTLIPMVRVQHVDTSQGPFLKRYGLSTVTISTAATTHEIPALPQEEAAQLRDQIARLARKEERYE
ncbi:PH domain-containing protein [Aureibacillus halotolerans]|uniref:YdbS-like PH domain-containing protein n=1 Tax=Aureibacillus halotolerans TaxID=1508390 RepID=A0A4R6TUC7_9BACI|nr:PH domain-containing protein [Aureibacillus halotolerans]TDQ36736.1 hypothetical protein EV213_11634 [Aureibacillus halotolerans]